MADIQYAQLYFVRALLMNKRLADTIQRAWPNVRSESPQAVALLAAHSCAVFCPLILHELQAPSASARAAQPTHIDVL